MEEGPEPQELMEHVEHNLDEKEEHAEKEKSGDHKSKHMRSAITAAVLAVFAALGSLLSGHAANEAILLQSRASDQWSYFQAKSTKGHMYEVNRDLVEALAKIMLAEGSAKGGGKEQPLKDLSSQVDAKVKGYEKDKKEIEEKANDLEKESGHEFAAHQMYSFAVACFQIGIVLASVSILVENVALYSSSVVAGAIGLGLLILGYVR